MNLVFLGLGANLGNRFDALQAAIHHLASQPEIQLIQQSRFCETLPEDGTPQPKYLNGVVEITTTLDPLQLLAITQEIEIKLGRSSKGDNAPRPIDIDILFFNDLCFESPELTIPHPRIQNRIFVLAPLMELAPTLLIPGTFKSISDCYRELVRYPSHLLQPVLIHQDDLSIFALQIAPLIKPGLVVRLNGEMGAGKTTFVRELMAALGSDENVSSPTFTLVNVYEGPIRIGHIDLYRLDSDKAVETLDLEHYLEDGHTALLIEWSEKLPASWRAYPGFTIQIKIVDEFTREFSIFDNGSAQT